MQQRRCSERLEAQDLALPSRIAPSQEGLLELARIRKVRARRPFLIIPMLADCCGCNAVYRPQILLVPKAD